MNQDGSRRSFLKKTIASAAAVMGGSVFATPGQAAVGFGSPSERPVFGFIGAGIRHKTLFWNALPFGPCAAICDVDSAQLRGGAKRVVDKYRESNLPAPPISLYEDYRFILDRQDIDVVVIATPDHWHAKMAIEAMRAGKDVYCEKPLTLTIDEGKQILQAEKETGRVIQVGTHQRSIQIFQTAAAMVRGGRVGTPKRITCGIGGCAQSGPLPAMAPPSGMNWNRWLGPAPWVPYRAGPASEKKDYWGVYPHGRAHGHFRWWYEYSGGKVTDWGAHHIDIALWALGNKSDGNMGRFTIDPVRVDHHMPFEKGMPTLDDRFNVATGFDIRINFEDGTENGTELDIIDAALNLKFDNGIMYEGDAGRIFVNRGKLTGKAVEELEENPLPEDAYDQLYPGLSGYMEGPESLRHMQNFVNCIKTREKPWSDVASHHRHLTVCHATNLAMRLGRKLTFDPATEQFIDDERANEMLSRTYRKGFEIDG